MTEQGERNERYDTITEIFADHRSVLNLSLETLATTKIDLFFHDVWLASASGFVYRYAKHYALVTNWHVLAGAHPETKVRRNTDGMVPNRIQFHCSVHDVRSHKFSIRPIELDLYVDGQAIWYERAVDSQTIDIAIVDLCERVSGFQEWKEQVAYIRGGQMVVQMDEDQKPKFCYHAYPRVGNDVFILGYPRGVAQGAFPIWKKGSIASEPLYGAVKSGAPVILVDALSKEGMSGAPVLYFGTDVIGEAGPGSPTAHSNQPWLVGVYAGREGVTEEEHDLSLGRVWKTEELEKFFNPSWRRPGPYLGYPSC